MGRFILLVLEDKYSNTAPELNWETFQAFVDDFDPPAGTRLVAGKFMTEEEATVVTPELEKPALEGGLSNSTAVSIDATNCGIVALETRGAKF